MLEQVEKHVAQSWIGLAAFTELRDQLASGPVDRCLGDGSACSPRRPTQILRIQGFF